MNTVTRYQDHAAFSLRLVFGVILLAHGLLKLIVFTPSGTAAYFASLGFPEVLAYLTIALEVGGGLALILGFYTRLTALASIPVLAGATWVHLSNGWVFSNQGGGWELPALLVILAAIIATQGAGS
ncbi:MAG: putative oxidoreductase [Arenicella sp.]|jgi:putative oxidoreductase